ncbi:MAG: hypothetical protein HY580_05875 [Nitrospinae bacterium]|nr:hypothetical protein [Nitrospinota bacterium]
MKQTFFADTSFLVAFYNSRDDHHRQARDFIADLSKRKANTGFIITDYIFDETLTDLPRNKWNANQAACFFSKSAGLR